MLRIFFPSRTGIWQGGVTDGSARRLAHFLDGLPRMDESAQRALERPGRHGIILYHIGHGPLVVPPTFTVAPCLGSIVMLHGIEILALISEQPAIDVGEERLHAHVMQDDDARIFAARLPNLPMKFGIVSDVVERRV